MPDLESWCLSKALAEAIFTPELRYTTLPQFTIRAPGSRGALLPEGREGEKAAGW